MEVREEVRGEMGGEVRGEMGGEVRGEVGGEVGEEGREVVRKEAGATKMKRHPEESKGLEGLEGLEMKDLSSVDERLCVDTKEGGDGNHGDNDHDNDEKVNHGSNTQDIDMCNDGNMDKGHKENKRNKEHRAIYKRSWIPDSRSFQWVDNELLMAQPRIISQARIPLLVLTDI